VSPTGRRIGEAWKEILEVFQPDMLLILITPTSEAPARVAGAGTEPGKAEEVCRRSENAIFELGAASVLYDNRIVIFKEDRVSFPSDFSDLGYIEFS
jgi:hypothetical protein